MSDYATTRMHECFSRIAGELGAKLAEVGITTSQFEALGDTLASGLRRAFLAGYDIAASVSLDALRTKGEES